MVTVLFIIPESHHFTLVEGVEIHNLCTFFMNYKSNFKFLFSCSISNKFRSIEIIIQIEILLKTLLLLLLFLQIILTNFNFHFLSVKKYVSIFCAGVRYLYFLWFLKLLDYLLHKSCLNLQLSKLHYLYLYRI